MSELRALYQEVILDHYKSPRNFREIEGAQRRIDGYNPLCGDKVTVFLDVEDGRVADISFKGVGCAISTASASLMTEAVMGKTVEEAEFLLERFHDLLTGSDGSGPAATDQTLSPEDSLDGDLGKLEVLSGVREYPVRIKCATLAWHALKAALDENSAEAGSMGRGRGDVVSTE
jgi:nitrogen fixation NifU-like protein